MTKIGFIGLGIMGSRMAANLQKAGFELVVHNRTKEKAAALVENGAVWAETPREVAQQVELVFTMLAHPEAVVQAALGEHGFLEPLPLGATWVDCSTTNPNFARGMAAQANARGVYFLDAPVAGTKAPAEAGTLRFFVGGHPEDVARLQPCFEAMGSSVNHVGDVGMGISLKLVVNHLLGTSMLAFAEGLALGEALGISQEALFSTLVSGPVTAPFVKGKQGKIASDDYEADFPLVWLQKDLQMANQSAYELGVPMPVNSAAKEAYLLAVQNGFGELDFSAIYRFLKPNH